jgi:hypothetical protein
MSAQPDTPSESFERQEHRVEPGENGAVWVRALPGRRRGRPPEMSATELLDRIRRLAMSRAGLFRVHRRFSSLYARARRNFGSWSAAVQAAGLDYRAAMTGARQRSLKNRRRRARRTPVPR